MSETIKKLYELNDQLVLRYLMERIFMKKVRITINENRTLDKKKLPKLYKLFTICITNGYIVEMKGPFYATQNNVEIIKILLNDPNGLPKIMKASDICIVDREDVVKELKERRYKYSCEL